MSAFEQAFAIAVGVEGGFCNERSDSGNWTGGKIGAGTLLGTKYGISAASYPTLDIPNLTLADAHAIYERDFWDATHCDLLPPPVAALAFDAAVNQGEGWEPRMIQEALKVPTDGVFGSVTKAAIARADPEDFFAEIVWLREVRYRAAGAFAVYGHGWIRRLAIAAIKCWRVTA